MLPSVLRVHLGAGDTSDWPVARPVATGHWPNSDPTDKELVAGRPALGFWGKKSIGATESRRVPAECDIL